MPGFSVKCCLLFDLICVFHAVSFYYFSCPPRTFLPALCKIFLDEYAPDNVLEVTARAITYYLDVSGMCFIDSSHKYLSSKSLFDYLMYVYSQLNAQEELWLLKEL